MTYDFQDIKEAYIKVGVEKGRTVMLRTDVRLLGPYNSDDQRDLLPAHFNALSELLDFGEGTLVVSASSTYLCNTDTPFDPEKTRSERGVLTEYIRKQPGAVRSFHPFMSYVSIGKHADYICNDVSRHAFGPETPKDRMLNLDTLYLGLGLEPRKTCTVVHHAEMMMGVPYRYTKEFCHPVVRNDGIRKELFYLYVWYKEMELRRNRNVNIFKHFIDSGYTFREAKLGKGKIYSYSMSEFYKSSVNFLKDDIYGWLDEPPEKRPYIE